MTSRPILFFFALALLTPGALAMGLIATSLKETIYFKPGFDRTYEYVFTTNSGFTEDYELYARMEKGDVDLTKSVTIDKYLVKDVPTGSAVPFTVRLKLPDTIEKPGIYEIRAGARETQTLGQGTVGVRTAAEARYIVIVLCPFVCIGSSFAAPNGNVNDTITFSFTVQNLGEETITAKGRVEIYDGDLLLGVARADDTEIPSTETKVGYARFDTTGLAPGTYRARGILKVGEITNETNASFIIGTRNVIVDDYTKEFVKDAINKMAITIRSGWNSKMKNLYADVHIFDGTAEVASFKTTPSELAPWDTTTLLGYFDTTGLAMKEYTARMDFFSDGPINTYEGTANITASAATETVKEVPKDETPKSIPKISGVIIGLLSFIAVLLLVFIILLVLIFKKKGGRNERETSQRIIPPSPQGPPLPPNP